MKEVIEETKELESIETNYTNVVNQQQVLAVSNHMYKFVVNQKDVLVNSPKSELIFVDIFDYIDFDLSVAKGILQLKLNGKGPIIQMHYVMVMLSIYLGNDQVVI